MKKTKQILAIILSAIILVAAIPFSASAANVVSEVDVEMNAQAGMDYNELWENTTVLSEGMEVLSMYDDLPMLVMDEEYTIIYGELEMGETYIACFGLYLEEGYSLPGSEFELQSVKVNGEDVEFYLETDEYGNGIILIYYTFSLSGEISEVEVSLNIYGDMRISDIENYAQIESQGTIFEYGKYSPVKVFDVEGNEVKDCFEAGKEYDILLYISPKNNCTFAKDEDGNFALDSVKINGENAEYTVNSYISNGYYEYIEIKATVTAKTAKYITELNIDIDTDLLGVSVYAWNDYITINTEGVKFDEDNGDDAVFAYDSWGYDVYSFDEPDVYTLYIYFNPEEGYFFPEDEMVNLIVNGEEQYNYYISSFIGPDGDPINFIGVEVEVDLIGDGFFARIAYFFNSIARWFRELFSGFIYY